jgi:hypothetical protein
MGSQLNVAASAMWQRITGRIEVLDDVVRVEIDLPWIMQLLSRCTGRATGDHGALGFASAPKPEG